MEKIIMKAYFANTGRLVCVRQSMQSRELSAQILELMADIYGRRDLLGACTEIMEKTELLRTATDCTLLGADELPVAENLRCYLDMKARRVAEYELQTPETFDRELLAQNSRHAAAMGDRNGIALSAVLDWLDGNREMALRRWMVLAYAGNRFAMQALEYAGAQLGDAEAAGRWKMIRKIFNETESRFSLMVDPALYEGETRHAAETAQIILAVRNRCAELQAKHLPLAMIQYAVDSTDPLSTKLRNLYNTGEPYCVMLVKQARKEEKKYGF